MAMQTSEWIDAKGNAFPRIEATGQDLSEAFRDAARGFFSLFTDLDRVQALEKVVIHCESSDTDWLVSDWMNTLVYEVRERKMLFSRYEIHVEGIGITGVIWGERIDPVRHPLHREAIAGAAFDLLFGREPEGDSPAAVSVVLNDVARHPLPLRELWRASE